MVVHFVAQNLLLKEKRKTHNETLTITQKFKGLKNKSEDSAEDEQDSELSSILTLSSGCILSTGSSKGCLLLRFSMADWASAIAHLSIGWGKVFWTRS